MPKPTRSEFSCISNRKDHYLKTGVWTPVEVLIADTTRQAAERKRKFEQDISPIWVDCKHIDMG